MNLAALAIIAALVISGSALFLETENISLDRGVINTPLIQTAPSATPFPFQELTIPYLRSREYKSTLGELTKYSDHASYTAYLTSYNSDGLKINGMLTIPKGEALSGGHPAIVFVHGYIAPSIYQTTTRYNDYVDYLARSGFVVFKIDLRGHGESQGEAGGAYYSSDYIIDTLNAYSALQTVDFIDPGKIGLWGHSMAGNVTFRSFIAKTDIPAVVIWAGAGYTYSDLLDYRLMDTSYRAPQQSTERARKRQLLREAYGDFNPESIFWKQVAPTNYLNGVRGAISLQHAVDDSVVSIEYSRNLKKILDSSTISNELNEYQSGGHNLSGRSFTQAMQKTVEFFKKNLK